MQHPRINKISASGLGFVCIGLFAAFQSRDYRLGSAMQMGPGYFPFCLGVLLALLGLASLVRGLVTGGEPVGRWRLPEPAMVIASVAFFGLTVDRIGLAPAVCGVIVISCLDRLLRRPVEVIAMAAGLSVLTSFLFVKLLGLPFKSF